jgi:hypothetical protein
VKDQDAFMRGTEQHTVLDYAHAQVREAAAAQPI